jgi:cyanate permease
VIGLPAALIIRHRPEDYGYLPDGEAQEEVTAHPLPAEADFNVSRALRTSTFWFLSLSIGLQSLVLQAVILHIMPYLDSIGLSRQSAAWIAMFIPLFSVLGRLGLGWLGDIWDKKFVLCLAFGLQTVGMALFIYARTWSLFLPFLFFFGVGYGGTIPLRAAIQREYFGRAAFGGIQGLMVSVMTGLSILGPPLAGRIFDITGSYHIAWLIFTGALLLAIPLLLALRRPAERIKTPSSAGSSV